MALLAAFAVSAHAHQPDTSYLRVTITPAALELRFTFDVFTLQRIAILDGDGNFEVSRKEMEGNEAAIFDFLRDRVIFEMNMRGDDLGDAKPMEWPEEAGDAVALKDYHQELVHFPFVKRIKDTPEDFYIGFDVFDVLGERHTILGTVIHGKRQFEIIFDQFEPDFLYDTGYRAPELSTWRKVAVHGAFIPGTLVLFLLAALLWGERGRG